MFLFFYPLLESIWRIFGLDVDKLRLYFINKNNKKIISKIKNKKIIVENKNILIILPHCLQNIDCEYKVTWNKLNNCRRCGKCVIPHFLDIEKEFNIKIVVVGGGTSARLSVKEHRPSLIIAVACENDAMSGLKDVKKIPVIAIINERKFGPCMNTTVDHKAIRDVLKTCLF